MEESSSSSVFDPLNLWIVPPCPSVRHDTLDGVEGVVGTKDGEGSPRSTTFMTYVFTDSLTEDPTLELKDGELSLTKNPF